MKTFRNIFDDLRSSSANRRLKRNEWGYKNHPYKKFPENETQLKPGDHFVLNWCYGEDFPAQFMLLHKAGRILFFAIIPRSPQQEELQNEIFVGSLERGLELAAFCRMDYSIAKAEKAFK